MFRIAFVGLCATSGAIVACSHSAKNVSQPPMGSSTAEGPANNDAPPPDASGPVQPSDVGEGVPGAMVEHHSALRVAQAGSGSGYQRPGQPGVNPRPPGIGSGSGSGYGSGYGSGSGMRPGPGRGSGSNLPRQPGQPNPGQPGQPTPPAPGQPTPGQPVPPVTQPTR